MDRCGPCTRFHAYQTFVCPQTWARVANGQHFDILPIRKIVFVEENHVEADLQGATDRNEVLQMFYAWINPIILRLATGCLSTAAHVASHFIACYLYCP